MGTLQATANHVSCKIHDVLQRINEIQQSSATRPHLVARQIKTPIGPMIAVSDGTSLRLLEFYERRALPTELERLAKRHASPITTGQDDILTQTEGELDAYFAGHSADFRVPIAWHGSDFTTSVWIELGKILPGQTVSYGELAQWLGRPTAARAVARANGANELAIIVPCHRVIGANGQLTGYAGGLPRKKWLIDHEKHCFGQDSAP